MRIQIELKNEDYSGSIECDSIQTSTDDTIFKCKISEVEQILHVFNELSIHYRLAECANNITYITVCPLNVLADDIYITLTK